VPGSTSCETIDGVLVDTGSSGLRLLSSVVALPLPQQTSGGNPVAECGQFEDGYTWGPVQSADISIAGEKASAAPIQIIGVPGFPAAPNACTSTGPSENTLDTLGANGILGVGLFRQDCGPACVTTGASNPGFYFACPSSGCVLVAESLTQQLQNPVWMFPQDNNGVIIELPSITATGATLVNGSMVFGIGTQSNNGLGTAAVFTVTGDGSFTTTFKGQSYAETFIDSGSNAIFFLDSKTTGLPLCPDTSDFYCPSTSQSLTATQVGANGRNGTVTFSVANADPFLSNPLLFAFAPLAGPSPGGFDWGLPFFFGRNVFTAIESQSTPGGFGPYWAY